jgi:hypothetical protein
VIGAFPKVKGVAVIADAEMQRTATSKIVHRALRERIVTAASA